MNSIHTSFNPQSEILSPEPSGSVWHGEAMEPDMVFEHSYALSPGGLSLGACAQEALDAEARDEQLRGLAARQGAGAVRTGAQR